MVLIKNKDFTIKLNRYDKILDIYPVIYNEKKYFVRIRTYILTKTGFIEIYNYKKRKGILKLLCYKGKHLYTFCTSLDLFEAVSEFNRKGILKLLCYKRKHLYTFCTSLDLFEAVSECNKMHILTLLPETLEDIFDNIEKIKAEKQKIIEWNGVVAHIENAATNNIL